MNMFLLLDFFFPAAAQCARRVFGRTVSSPLLFIFSSEFSFPIWRKGRNASAIEKATLGEETFYPHSHKQRLVIDLLACSFCLSFSLSLCAIASVLVEWENIIKRVFSWPASGADLAGKTHFTLTVICQRSRDRRTTARWTF